MITIFNRRELTVAISMEQQAEIRARLAAHNIKYYFKVHSLLGDRATTGSFGINMDAAYECIFYVHKKDYDAAMAALYEKYN